MNFFNLIILTGQPEGFMGYFWQFLKNIKDFFTGKGDVLMTVMFPIAMILLSFFIVAFLVSGSFYKIVKEEMDKGGEEYGEIASTKVVSRAVLYRILSVLALVVTIIGLFAFLIFY